MRILLVDGDKQSSAFLKRGLSSEGFAVDVAPEADKALELAGRIPYDALLVNGNLPEREALAILAALRKQRCPAAVLMYDDRERPRDKDDAVLAGLDDYLSRPTLSDLTARLYAAMRRAARLESGHSMVEELKWNDLRMDLDSRRVTFRRKEIHLTKKEFELLECLMRHPRHVFSQEAIAQEIWNIDYEGHSNVVQTLVKRVRAKFGERFPTHLIQTVRGFGYRLAA
jgi:DNA-binding response OmpR family regulator